MYKFKNEGVFHKEVDGIPLKIQYGYNEFKGVDEKIRKYPQIIKIFLGDENGWDLTYLTEHHIQEQIRNDIFRTLNQDIYK
jgi:hypothetical protein